MTQEEKQLLLKDLCSRLPYDIQGITSEGVISPLITKGEADWDILTSLNYRIVKYGWRPYFRSMSSMTEAEIEELKELTGTDEVTRYGFSYQGLIGECFGMMYDDCSEIVDWLNKKMFDYRGLIPMNLALPAPEGMYNNKNNHELHNNRTKQSTC